MQGPVFYTMLFLVMLGVLLATGTWIGTVLGMIAVSFFYLFLGGGSLKTMGYVIYTAWSNYTVTAIPLFIFMATILSSSGVGERLFSGAAALFSRFPGGLLHANVAASAAFGAVCGSTAATTAAISKVAIPYLEREGYPTKLALGSLLCAGGLGLMIPPSGGMIIYGALCDVSVGKLFIAGILPGILLATLFMGYIAVFCKITKPNIPSYKTGFKRTVSSLMSTWPVAALFFGLMGGIFFGVFTPTEAAGIGVMLSIIIAAWLRRLNRAMMLKALTDGLTISVIIYFIYGGGMLVGAAVSNLGVPQGLAAWIEAAQLSRVNLLIAVSILYLLLGCVMDALAAIIITLPIIFPAIVAAGLDPVWFGIVEIIYCEMAAITPPIGVNLFVIQGMTGKPLKEVASGVLPFVLLYLLAIPILYLFPDIALFLPRMLGY